MDKLTKYKDLSVWLFLIYIVLGLILILWPDVANKTISFIIGAVLLIFSIVKIIHYFSESKNSFNFDIAYAIIGALFGLFLIIFPKVVVEALAVILGILIVFDSILRIQLALYYKTNSMQRWGFTLALALITAIFGIVMMFDPFKGAAWLTVALGIVLLLSGLLNLIDYIAIKRLLK